MNKIAIEFEPVVCDTTPHTPACSGLAIRAESG